MADETPLGETPETPQNETFEDWLNGQPDDVQTRIADHISGLKTALDSERDNAKTLSKRVKDLQASVGDNAELKKQVDDLQNALEESRRRQAFMDSAAGAGCTNARAAYRFALADGELWRRDGTPDWAAIKEAVPELFGVKQPRGAAGNGKDNDGGAGGRDPFSDWIRAQRH